MAKLEWQKANAEKHREYQKTYRLKNIDRYRLLQKRKRDNRSETQKQKDLERTRLWRKLHPQPRKIRVRKYLISSTELLKKQARRKVRYFVDRGIIIKKNCIVCASPKVEAHHHNGYQEEFALDVIWLCKKHHLQEHHTARLVL